MGHQTEIDLDRPFEETLRVALSLPKGTKIMRTGILQTEDFPAEPVKALQEMGATVEPLPKAISYGAPSDEEVTEAVRELYKAKGLAYENFSAAHPKHLAKVPISPTFFINSQGNLLACAQKRSRFAEGQACYCYDTGYVHSREIGEEVGA